jgi:hypothetical protein
MFAPNNLLGLALDHGFVPRRARVSDGKLFKCKYPNCDKNYYDKSSLIRHYRLKHPDSEQYIKEMTDSSAQQAKHDGSDETSNADSISNDT